MPLRPDVQDIITTIIYDNLASLAATPPVLAIPPGFEDFFFSVVFNNFTDLGLPEDVRQLVVTAVTSDSLVVIS